MLIIEGLVMCFILLLICVVGIAMQDDNNSVNRRTYLVCAVDYICLYHDVRVKSPFT